MRLQHCFPALQHTIWNCATDDLRHKGGKKDFSQGPWKRIHTLQPETWLLHTCREEGIDRESLMLAACSRCANGWESVTERHCHWQCNRAVTMLCGSLGCLWKTKSDSVRVGVSGGEGRCLAPHRQKRRFISMFSLCFVHLNSTNTQHPTSSLSLWYTFNPPFPRTSVPKDSTSP